MGYCIERVSSEVRDQQNRQNEETSTLIAFKILTDRLEVGDLRQPE